jgi:hypothetical protein
MILTIHFILGVGCPFLSKDIHTSKYQEQEIGQERALDYLDED